MKFTDKFGKERLFFDGAMGTLLQEKGLRGGELPELWNFDKPDIIKNIHSAYLAAGCDIIKANTFGANRFKLENTPYTVEQTVSQAVGIAKSAIAECGREAWCALDIGSLGKLLKPLGDLAFEEAYDVFGEIVAAGENAGADLVLIETMNEIYEIKAAVLAAKEKSSLPIIVTMIFDDKGKLLSGGDIDTAVAMLEGLGVDGIGFNCGVGPKQMMELVPKLEKISSTPIICNPNADLPVVINGKTVFNVTPEEFAEDMTKIAQYPVYILGGCCGTTPEHLRAMIDVCKNIRLKKITEKNLTVVSSYNRAEYFGERPLIIGERINPTGKSKFKQALRDNNIQYILNEAIAQEENGAHILDVNVGLPEIDEPDMMYRAITSIQEICPLPLQIDTSDMTAMERAMRIYNGKPLINSVNGKKESMDAVFPLVKKYGGAVICLTLDENGIPETAEERIKIAEKIIKTAESYGISKKNLIVDTLTITISTGQQNARITLDALKYIRRTLGVHTALGVSNISFGLPIRENINTAFFTLALENGLSAGIINPGAEPMMRAYHSFCALNGSDENCEKYIEIYSDSAKSESKSVAPTGDMPLFDAVVRGMAEPAKSATENMLKSAAPLDIINNELVPALDKVGIGFEKGTVFLPQLLMSADAAKAAFEVIKSALSNSGEKQQSKGKVIVATVKGDIHDIGKNIVKVLLENYGFDVIDLGKDVEPELIVDTAIRENVRLIGLSALMTTTVVSMEQTIKLLHERGVDCKVMVGGAVLTQTYADMIHADFYGKDAMTSVRYALELFK